jgi:hypothetical protein
MSSITVNGKNYVGSSVTIMNGKVIVNGKEVTPEDSKVITINIEGDVEELNVDVCEKITIKGNVKNIQTSSGDVECNNITGSIQSSSGDIECGDVGGSIQTSSGDVKCGTISGNVRTNSGDIKHK